MPVVYADAAMFSNFCSRRGVDDTELGLHDDVRDSGVSEGITESLGDETLPVNDIVDLQCGAVAFEVLDGGFSVFVVLEKYESDVVGLIAGYSVNTMTFY